jgi:hypothetical protein
MGVWQGVADGHGLPKESLGPAMLYPSTPCARAGGLRLSPTPLDTPRLTPLILSENGDASDAGADEGRERRLVVCARLIAARN